nr:unnamed protein product [Digitaria exilis]
MWLITGGPRGGAAVAVAWSYRFEPPPPQWTEEPDSQAPAVAAPVLDSTVVARIGKRSRQRRSRPASVTGSSGRRRRIDTRQNQIKARRSRINLRSY